MTKVLVVDDESVARDLLRLMLRPAGFQISEAVDGLEALEKVTADLPDIVLLDVMMPNMDGITACTELRRLYPPNKLPIVMLSDKSHYSTIDAVLAAGANQYLTKPVGRKDLIAIISSLVAG